MQTNIQKTKQKQDRSVIKNRKHKFLNSVIYCFVLNNKN